MCIYVTQGENARFTYRLNDTSGAFMIDPVTGWLSVTNSTPLDRERVGRLALQVEAVEQKPNLLTENISTARIDLELTDANDNSPIFQPTNLYSFTVDAVAGTGTVIGQVSTEFCSFHKCLYKFMRFMRALVFFIME